MHQYFLFKEGGKRRESGYTKKVMVSSLKSIKTATQEGEIGRIVVLGQTGQNIA
jgi:hypothetical protein